MLAQPGQLLGMPAHAPISSPTPTHPPISSNPPPHHPTPLPLQQVPASAQLTESEGGLEILVIHAQLDVMDSLNRKMDEKVRGACAVWQMARVCTDGRWISLQCQAHSWAAATVWWPL